MIKVNFQKKSNYAASTVKIKKALAEFLANKGIVSDAVVNVTLVGETEMKALGKKYLGEAGKPAHNVLSFTESEVKDAFVYPPSKVLQLGEIVVCYPVAVTEAAADGTLTDDKIIGLVTHGALHLLGIHHTE